MDFLRGKVPDGEEADRLVERALFLMATGYAYTEERREGGREGRKDRPHPQAGAAQRVGHCPWLSHRMPERWGNGAAEVPENNLLTLLREELEGGEDDGVSAVQSEAAPGDDLVAGAGERSLTAFCATGRCAAERPSAWRWAFLLWSMTRFERQCFAPCAGGAWSRCAAM